MAMICDKCKGVIPDISFGNKPWDCESHIKPNLDIEINKRFVNVGTDVGGGQE